MTGMLSTVLSTRSAVLFSPITLLQVTCIVELIFCLIAQLQLPLGRGDSLPNHSGTYMVSF